MLVLAVDSSTKTGSVAIYDDKKGVIAELSLNAGFNHSETLLKSIHYIFDISKLKLEDMDLLAVAVGPGSFTGIRVGVGIIKGFAISQNLPVVGVNNLDVLANSVISKDKTVYSVIDARKGRVFYGKYNYYNGEYRLVDEYQDGEIVDLLNSYSEKNIFIGDGVVFNKDKFDNSINEPMMISRASVLAKLALNREKDNINLLEPYYHKKTQAEREKELKDKAL